MELVGFGLAVIAIGVAVALWVVSSKQKKEASAAQQALQARFDAETARAEASASAAAEALEKINVLQAELDAAVARNDEKAITEALWNLELERNLRQWSDVIVPSENSPAADGVSIGGQLTSALGHEVDRLREEVGVAIRFDGALDAEFSPEVALATLRITSELLSLTAKHCDEVVLSLDQMDAVSDSPSELVIALDCFAWDGDEAPEVSTKDLADMAGRVDGSLVWSTVADDEVKAELRIVLPASDELGAAVDVTDGTVASA